MKIWNRKTLLIVLGIRDRIRMDLRQASGGRRPSYLGRRKTSSRNFSQENLRRQGGGEECLSARSGGGGKFGGEESVIIFSRNSTLEVEFVREGGLKASGT